MTQGSGPASTIRVRYTCNRPIAGAWRSGLRVADATETAAEQVLSLPIYPELTDAQVTRVCEALRRF